MFGRMDTDSSGSRDSGKAGRVKHPDRVVFSGRRSERCARTAASDAARLPSRDCARVSRNCQEVVDRRLGRAPIWEILDMGSPEADAQQHLAMLRILYGASATALDAFRAANNAVDAQLVADIEAMVKRTEGEIERLAAHVGKTR